MSWIDIENKFLEKFAMKIHNLKNKKELITFCSGVLDKKYKEKDFTDIKNIIKILKKLTINDLTAINNGEKFNFIKYKKNPNINLREIRKYVVEKKLKVSYSIFKNKQNIVDYKNKVYAMHSIGKVFTGYLIMIMLDIGVITDEDIKKPLHLDKNIFNKLPQKVRGILLKKTMLDVMTHKSGIRDYVANYLNKLGKNTKINPVEPEDFVEFIDSEVYEFFDEEIIYSNAGILLCGLSIKHLYNKRTKENLSYNDILFKYIIEPAKLISFSISRPKNGAVGIC